jgi:hypothetical protein
MANTYFCNRIAPIEGLNRVIAVSASCHDEGIFFCVPRRVVHKGLSRMIIRWKSPASEVFLDGEIMEIVDGDSQTGREYRSLDGSRPWGDLASWDEGSVIRIRNIRLTDPPAEVLNLHHIQSCKYLAL